MRKLVELVPRRQFDPKVNNCIDWVAIGAKLNRIPSICKFKWRDLVNTTLKKGAFSEKEDALITKRVMERGRKGNNMKGFWMSLQQEMSRSNSALSQRWNRVLKPRLLLHSKNPTRSLQVARSKNLKRQVRVRWTKEMVNISVDPL